MSGSLFTPWAIARYPRVATIHVARALACRTDNDEEVLDCLRSRDSKDILQAFNRQMVLAYPCRLFNA